MTSKKLRATWARCNTAIIAAASLSILASCTDDDSTTDLNPDGPPMIRQVFVNNQFERTTGTQTVLAQDRDLIFGSLPDFVESTRGTNTNLAAAASDKQEIRIVIDELLLGNSLEELECADGIFSSEYAPRNDDGSYIEFPIPVGTTPQDVSNCSGPQASLVGNSEGRNCTKVCVGPDGQVGDSGLPIGILDENEDGAADSFQLFQYGEDQGRPVLGVKLVCDGQNILVDRQRSFWQPAGNQLLPQAGSLLHRAIGPAVVLFPRFGLRTSSTCSFEFNNQVTDKDLNTVCAPPDGDVTQECASPTDVSNVTFESESYRVLLTQPPDGGTLAISDETQIQVAFNAAVDAESAENIILETEAGAPVDFTVNWNEATPVVILLSFEDGTLTPDTTYNLAIPTTVTDFYGGALLEPLTVSFSTNPLPEV